MAREHGRILSRIWSDPDWRTRSPAAQRLYFLLLSQRTINNCGVLPLMVSKWARGSVDTTPDDIQTALAELCEHRYVVIDRDTEEALVRSFIRNDGVAKQPNVLKSALRQAREIESLMLRRVLAAELRRLGREDADATAYEIDSNPSRTLPEPLPERSSNPSAATPPEPFGNPSDETHAEPIAHPPETPDEPTANPSQTPNPSGTLPEPFAEVCGDGVGEGGISSPVGGSVGRSHARSSVADDRPETWRAPPSRCPRHRNTENPPPCGPCGDARRAREQWDRERELDQIMTTRRCPLCDAEGWRYELGTRVPLTPYVRCDHTPIGQEVRHA